MTTLTGGCLCGAIRYRLDADIKDLRACHCTHCQKASGTGGSVNAVLPSAQVKFTQGTPKRYDAKAESGRTLYRFFCADCGSPLYSQRQSAPETMVLRIGTLDSPPDGLKISAHIWMRSARSWDAIDPGAKQFPQQPDSPPATK